MRKILLTGGAGFVGRHFVKRFLEVGDRVICVDNLAPLTGGIDPRKGWPLFDPRDFDNFIFHPADCRDFFRSCKDTDFDYVLHLAAVVGGREIIENNPLAVADDLSIDSQYWQWAVETKPKQTICFSSSAAYPIHLQTQSNYRLLKESDIGFDDSIGQPDMSYGWAKLTHEYLALLAYEKHGIHSVTYRPFSGYGEDQDDCYPFPSICKRALLNRDRSRLTVWGTGEQMRDFIHIEDCVDGVLATMDEIRDGSALNLSTGIHTSFLEFARMAANIVGYDPEVSGLSDKPSGVFARGGDTQKQRDYGFQHKIGFSEGIARALQYFESSTV